jgi:hypothetical protein
MTLEGVKIAKGRRPENGRTEVQVGGRENGVVILAARDKALNQVCQRRDAEPGGEMVVQAGERSAMEGRVVGQARIGGDGSSSGNVEIKPLRRLGEGTGLGGPAEGSGQAPRRPCRRMDFAHVGDLHRRRV